VLYLLRSSSIHSSEKSNMARSKLDLPVADKAPSDDTLTPYDRYPFSQHVSCIVGRVQHVESFHLSAKRRNETDSGLLLGHVGNRGAQGGSFLTVNLECRGQ